MRSRQSASTRALIAPAKRQSSWREGIRAALRELFAFVTELPLAARAIFNEVYSARGTALVKHEEILERLWTGMPQLMALLVAPYLGDDAAAEGLERPVPQPGAASQ